MDSTAAGDTFTLVQAGDIVKLYHNQPTTGTAEATVPMADLSALIVNGISTTTVNVDLSGGNPVPANVNVDSGKVAFGQDLGADGKAVDVSIASGATANFDTVEHLETVSIQPLATFTLVVPPTTTPSVSAPLDLLISSQPVTTPSSSNPAQVIVADFVSSDPTAAATVALAVQENSCPISDVFGGIVKQVENVADGAGKVVSKIINAGHLEPILDKDGAVVGLNWVWNAN